MASADLALLLFAFTMFPHILGASLVLGFSWFAFALELIGRRRDEKPFVDASRAVSRSIVLIYATIGSLGTAITVELFVLWPQFMGKLGELLWWPLAFAATMILSNFLLIAIYWYTYDKIRAGLHVVIGFLMALTSSLIPLNFRTIMSFTNEPVGLVANEVQYLMLYANPSLAPLYAHTIFASLSTTGFVICMGAAVANSIKRGDAKTNTLLFRNGLLGGIGFLVPQALAGAWYIWTLQRNVAQMFAAITGPLRQYSCTVGCDVDLSPLFASKLVVVGYLVLASVFLLRTQDQESFSGRSLFTAASVGLLAPTVIIIGEIMQEYSHLPYLVIGRFTVEEFLTPTFPLALPTIAAFIAGFVISMVLLLVILYTAYLKR